jgi:hypothetical protein
MERAQVLRYDRASCTASHAMMPIACQGSASCASPGSKCFWDVYRMPREFTSEYLGVIDEISSIGLKKA